MTCDYPCIDLFRSFHLARDVFKGTQSSQIPLFDVLSEYERECSDRLLYPDIPSKMELLLRQERNSWRLIRGVFDDRLKELGNSSSTLIRLILLISINFQKNKSGTMMAMKWLLMA